MEERRGIVRQMTAEEMIDQQTRLMNHLSPIPKLTPISEESAKRMDINTLPRFVKPWEKCPCDSGKIYEDCCMKKMSKGQYKRYCKRIGM